MEFLIYLLSLLVSTDAYMSAFYADNGLQQTFPIGRMSKRTRREMRHEILSLLGLHHRPKPSKSKKEMSGSKFLLDVYNSMEDEGFLYSPKHLEDNFNATSGTIRDIESSDVIMSFENKLDTLKQNLDHERRFYFDMTQVPVDQRLVSAELRLYRIANNYGYGPFRIYVYKVSQGRDAEDRQLRLIMNTEITQNFHGWLELNVTESAQLWSVFPAENLGLLIAVYDRYSRELDPGRIGLVSTFGRKSQRPFMLAFFKIQNEIRRSKRALKSPKSFYEEQSDQGYADQFYADRPQWTWGRMAYNKNDHQVCQMRLLYVSFKDLNWQDWIIAPEGYWAYFCYGECSFPLNSHMNATNHAVIQTLVHSMKPLLVPKPCCAPTKLSAISVLYFDNNSDVILKKYRNMVVKSCGCL